METPIISKIQLTTVTPTKSPHIQSLPPLSNGTLQIQKKRCLAIDSQEEDSTDQVIPVKPPVFSTPTVKKRVVSLQDASIPDLSPDNSMQSIEDSPSPLKMTYSSPTSFKSFSSPTRFTKGSAPNSSYSGCSIDIKQIEVKRHDKYLDAEIKKYEKQLETIKKAKQYLEKNDSDSIEVLINKWKNAAQMASNYLLGTASTNIEKMGGMSEFRRRERERKKRQLEFDFDVTITEKFEEMIESDEFKELSEFEKKDILSQYQEAQMEAQKYLDDQLKLEVGNDDQDDECDTLTMKQMMKQLNVDYLLVWEE